MHNKSNNDNINVKYSLIKRVFIDIGHQSGSWEASGQCVPVSVSGPVSVNQGSP